MRYRRLDTPTGLMALIEHADGRLAMEWVTPENEEKLAGGAPDAALLPGIIASLERYFAGEAVDFSGVPTPGGDGFFARCWAACRSIPRGETRSYAQLAEMAGGKAGAARAAGGAMRHNPLPIIVPCHRVVASGKSLGGFSGSTDPSGDPLRRKRWLLTLEGAL